MASEPSSDLVVVTDWRNRALDATAAQGMGNRPFSPGVPMTPFAGYSTPPREHDYQSGYNIAARPRRNERVSFATLRGIIDAYDVAQICIWHRINSVRSLGWNVIPRVGASGGNIADQVAFAKRVLEKPDRVLPFNSWLAKFLYDVLAFDAGCLYRIRNGANRAIGLRVIDGTTMAPLLDYNGGTPDVPAPAYVQYAQGVPWEWLTTDDLIYLPYQPVSNSPYGKAPLESVLLNANTDLRFQAYFLQRFTSGNIPEAFAGSPEGWGPKQIEDFQASWDALMYGDDTIKHQVKWVPHGTTFAWSNEKDFSDEFSLFLMRKTVAAYHIVPSELGFTEDVNRATSETQSDVQFRVGDLPLVNHVQGILTWFLQYDLGLDVEFQFDTGREKEDRLNTAQADKIYIDAGVVSLSEVRERVFGLTEPDGKMVARFVNNAKVGPIALSRIAELAGIVDPESGAPDPDAPASAPLALPAGSPIPQAADVGAAADLVVKAETVGLTTETGLYGNPMLLDEENIEDAVLVDDENRQDATEAAQIMKSELGAFRRFIKGRRRAGTWRDFDFAAFDPVLARRLNQAGRGDVRKSAGQLVAAGVALRADDTGRVLMLQRALDPTDPAAGTWEMPGGCLEDGETALGAACREWQEETGCLLPVESLVAASFDDGSRSWTSTNGVYQGFVLTVPSEASVPISGRAVINPDDPDGDMVEALAWWDPSALEGNPAVRPELGQDIGIVIAALTGVAEVVKGNPKGSWRDGANKAPQHAYDLRLTDYWTTRVQEALRAMYPLPRLRAAVDRAANAVVKADETHDVRAAAAAAGLEASGGDLEQILRQMIADGYLAGLHTASTQSGGYITSELGQVAADVDWSAWTPGDADAALAAADGGLAELLDQAGITVRGISGTLLDQLGNVIADGLAAGDNLDSIASSLFGIVGDESRAERIAHTETARAVDVATMDTYAANGIGQYEVLVADGACSECEDIADGNPYPVDDGGQVPVHPWCRCASAPIYTPGADEGAPVEQPEE